jgi:hypothetical protein
VYLHLSPEHIKQSTHHNSLNTKITSTQQQAISSTKPSTIMSNASGHNQVSRGRIQRSFHKLQYIKLTPV